MTTATRVPRTRKAAIVGRAEVIGLRPAAREAGVAESSLRYWRESPEFAQLRAEKRDEVVQDVWAAFQNGVRRGNELVAKTDDLSKVAIWTGVMYDKFALMTGGPTVREETRELTETMNDHEKTALRKVLEGVLE